MYGFDFQALRPFEEWEPEPIPLKRCASDVNAYYLAEKLANHPNRDFATYVVDLATHGARVRARGNPYNKQTIRANLRSGIVYADRVRRFLSDEVVAGRIEHLGSDVSKIHPRTQTWPLGVVPKKGYTIEEKGRVITDFSAADPSLPESLNSKISEDESSIKYTRVYDAVMAIDEYRARGLQPALASLDVEGAFRRVLIHSQDLHLACFSFPDADGRVQYYLDRVFGFGGRSSPAIFGALANAIHWIAEDEVRRRFPSCEFRMYHLADDFLVVGSTIDHTTTVFNVLLDVLVQLGIPTAPKKTVSPCFQLEYLGLFIDAALGAVSIPEDKRTRMSKDMMALLSKSRWNLKKTESIVGKLHFTHVCYPSMFPYISIFYARMAPAQRGGDTSLWPSTAMTQNLATLNTVINNNPRSLFSSFRASPTNAEITFAVDAAGRAGAGGFGTNGTGTTHAFHLQWPPGWSMDEAETSSALQELIAILLTVTTYGHAHRRINIWSDSLPAVLSLSKGFSTCRRPNIVIKEILRQAQELDVVVLVLWHKRSGSPSALAADALSRGLLLQARKLAPCLCTTALKTLQQQDFPIFGTR